MASVEAIDRVVQSAQSHATNPYGLEYAWYEPWMLALGLFLPTLTAKGLRQ
jgi:hypothetical protein